ncbi:MAG: polysaccharide biosynthesis/export family protein [Bacteroidales bacterium]|nr:polysaccharide biosynthesis/export family protein [Bacteroidales bacterium]
MSALLMLLVCSCGKHRYLQVPKGSSIEQDTLYQKSLDEYKIQSNDILHVKVVTSKEEFADLFNATSIQQQVQNTSSAYFYVSGYPVGIDGNIEMPVIGKVFVAGYTVHEIQQIIHEKVSKIVYENQVFVRLVSFRINIAGEVKNPGEYNIFRDQATILQALSLAGDMNYYGDRKDIMIVRTTEEGAKTYTIDLTQRDALSSPVFYLQPNDWVYVQPLPRTIFRVTVSDMITYISAISSSLALIVAILSLTK